LESLTTTLLNNSKQDSRPPAGERTAIAKKVLFVIDTLQPGGAEQSLLDIVTRFQQLRPVMCHIYTGDLLKQQFMDKGVRVHSVNLQKKYGFYSACKKLKAVVRTEQPDLVVACLTRSELVARIVAYTCHIPVVGTLVSDLYGKAYNQFLSPKAKIGVALFRLLNKTTARFCKGFIANSEAIKKSNAVQLGLPPEKIEVIHRGRDSRQFTFRPHSVLPGKPVRFLNIGRLVLVKGQRDLILAFQAFLQSCPGAMLHIAGDGPERASLAALIKELQLTEQVTLLGNRNDVGTLIREYDCFVLPSRSEGFSGAVVEAMLSGLPVLASNIPANKEMIRHLETGYLFETGSVAGITGALAWFTGNRQIAGEMAAKAHEHALQHFELDAIARKWENYLYKVTTGKT
jgi:glycosyltransferase involved in cell wall biosynthesis